MTEGKCEEALLNLLLERGLLIYNFEDLLYETIFHERQIKQSTVEKINQLPYTEKITIIRVGDKLSDKLSIPKEIKNRIIECVKLCIKPEFEILHIINEGKLKEYEKVKSSMKPCEFIHEFLKNYRKTYEYNYDYFNNFSNPKLIELIKKYSNKRSGTHQTDEKELLDYLKEW